jgi:hypothetical protein
VPFLPLEGVGGTFPPGAQPLACGSAAEQTRGLSNLERRARAGKLPSFGCTLELVALFIHSEVGMWKRSWRVAAAILAATCVLGFGVPFLFALAAPFSWEERDWDDDGRVSYREFVAAIGMGKMPAACPGGIDGTEYFDTKSTNVLKTDCERRWTGPRGARFL